MLREKVHYLSHFPTRNDVIITLGALFKTSLDCILTNHTARRDSNIETNLSMVVSLRGDSEEAERVGRVTLKNRNRQLFGLVLKEDREKRMEEY